MAEIVLARRNRSLCPPKAGLLVVGLLPWLMLTLSNGGSHNHALPDLQGGWGNVLPSGRVGGKCQWALARVEKSEATTGSRFCPACRWQLSSGTYPGTGPTESAAHSSADIADRVQIVVLAPVSRCFDSRAPPGV